MRHRTVASPFLAANFATRAQRLPLLLQIAEQLKPIGNEPQQATALTTIAKSEREACHITYTCKEDVAGITHARVL